MIIRGVGIDAAYANMGFARVEVNIAGGAPVGPHSVRCTDLILASTVPEDRKTVRRSSDHLRRARELQHHLTQACLGASFAFVEVPSGAQNANAAFGFGVAVGVLASCQVPVIEVNPMEVKEAVLGFRSKKGATKEQIIAWAVARWPSAPWLRHGGKIVQKNEHLADALAAVVAGITSPAFKQTLSLYAHAIPGNTDIGPTPRRPLLG